jgi:Spy/CpxP family protein refolding chaperone
MIRVRNLLLVGIPLLIALVWATSTSGANAGAGEPMGFWPAASDAGPSASARKQRPQPRPGRPAAAPVAAPDVWGGPPPPPPPPPVVGVPATPPVPPTPPTPPTGHRGRGRFGHGISVSIHDGKISIDGIDDMVHAQLDAVRDTLANNTRIPKPLRDKLLARIDKVRGIADRHLARIKASDVDALEGEMDKMSDEIQAAVEGMDEDLQKLGEQLGKDVQKKLGKDLMKHFDPKKLHIDMNGGDPDDNADDDDDDDTTPAVASTDDSGDDDMKVAIKGLKGMKLAPSKMDAIKKLRDDADRDVAAAKKQLEDASKKLEDMLADPKATEAAISTAIEKVGQKEVAIRKARLLVYVKARNLLDDGERKQLEAAAKKRHP